MNLIDIRNKNIKVRVSPTGGCIVDAFFNDVPILRTYENLPSNKINILKTANFPLVPFGNRVENNRFRYNHKDYFFKKNVEWDEHYLHGDVWLLDWKIVEETKNSVLLEVYHPEIEGEPYEYKSQQMISIVNNQLSIQLSVTNQKREPMPFGLGHHFFFPTTEKMLLKANHQDYWTEKKLFLPDIKKKVPEELNFNQFNSLPKSWMNNCFEGWDGKAEIQYPETNLSVHIQADSELNRFFLFYPYPEFKPNFQNTYFCFEPMSHTANGHNLEMQASGLKSLRFQEKFQVQVSLSPKRI